MNFSILTTLLVLLTALLHFYFLILEMFLWTKPIGLKTFRMSIESAQEKAVLAKNQGLYNGFLATGLLLSPFVFGLEKSTFLAQYLLICVIVAGIYGALTVSKKIFFIQSIPAIFALFSLYFFG